MPEDRAALTEAFDSQHLLRTAIDASPNGIVIVDRRGRILLANPVVGRWAGYDRGELVGQAVDVLCPDAIRASHAQFRDEFARTPEGRAMGADRTLSLRRKDGSELPVEIGLNPVWTPQNLIVIASVVDISERLRLERARESARQEQQAFEQLLMDISIRFLALQPEQVDKAIEEAQRRLVEFFDLDRCVLWTEKDGDYLLAAIWSRPEFAVPPGRYSARELFPWVHEKTARGEVVCVDRVAELPDVPDRANFGRFGVRSSVIVPLRTPDGVVGGVSFGAVRQERAWTPDTVNRLQLIGSIFGSMLARRQADEALRLSLVEISRLRDQLHAENLYLRREVQDRIGTGMIVGKSPAVQAVLEQVEQVAATDSTVLLLGETGSGKEMFAAEIHRLSARHARAMVRVNCAAIPATLIESELFGREKGAFTGAMARQIGRFELADHSTLFLDEIGDLAPEIQVKLLRVLEDGHIERLGSPKPIHVDTRVIAATHRDLQKRVAEGLFREDLFYRLNVFPIYVPPLRDRIDDLPLLVWRFVGEFSKAFGKTIDAIDKNSMAALQRYSWPGNIRELRNVVERAMIVAKGPRLTIAIPAPAPAAIKHTTNLQELEKEHIRKVLISTGWRIRGAGGAADRLGLRPTTLEARLARLGLKRPRA